MENSLKNRVYSGLAFVWGGNIRDLNEKCSTSLLFCFTVVDHLMISFFIIIIIIRATFLQLITSTMVTWSLQLATQWLSIFWTNCTVLWHTFVLIWKIIGNGLNLFSQIITQIYKKNVSCIRWFKAIETMAKLFSTTWTRNGRCLPL